MSGVALENTCNRLTHWPVPCAWAPIGVFRGEMIFAERAQKVI